MDKSIRFLEEARQMVGLKLWDLAANRFYYSCFHAAQALLLEYGFSAHYDVSEEEVATMIEPANCFVSTISELLYSNKKNNSDSLS